MAAQLMTRLTLGCFVAILGLADGGPLCASCSLLLQPQDCNVVTRCGDHEKCVVSKYITMGGLVRFDIGCESSFICNGGTPFGKRSGASLDVRGAKRSLHDKIPLCQMCCNDTKLCNIMHGLCGSRPLNTNGALLCYHCDQMSRPDGCDRIKLCGIDNQCYIGKKQNELSGHYLWETRCGENSTECRTLAAQQAIIIGKRQFTSICASCCQSGMLCNNQCTRPVPPAPTHAPTHKPTTTHAPTHKPTTTHAPTTTHKPTTTHAPTTTHIPTTTHAPTTTRPTTPIPLSPPVIQFITRPRDVQRGTNLHMQCIATGNPHPSIKWSYYSGNDNPPANIRIENNGKDLYIMGVSDQNYGQYACKATNSQGQDMRYVPVLEVGPSGP